MHAPGGIRTHILSRRAAADLRLRPRGHWDRHFKGLRVQPSRRELKNYLFFPQAVFVLFVWFPEQIAVISLSDLRDAKLRIAKFRLPLDCGKELPLT